MFDTTVEDDEDLDDEDLDLDSDVDDPEPLPAIDLSLGADVRLAMQVQFAAAAPGLLARTEVLDTVEAVGVLRRWLAGVRIRMLAEFADRHPADTVSAPPGADESGLVPSQRWVPDEVGLTEGISRLEALGEIAQARRFVYVLPDTLALLEAGRIDLRRAEAIARATAVLPDDKARAVEAVVLPKAPDVTLRQLRDRVRRAIARVDPDGEYRRHRAANTERRVSIRSVEDGMASLWFYGSAAEIEAAWQVADRLARSSAAHDPRTLDQRRFDMAMQVLQGRLTVTNLSDVDAAVSSILAEAGDAATHHAAAGTDTERGDGTWLDDTAQTDTAQTDIGRDDIGRDDIGRDDIDQVGAEAGGACYQACGRGGVGSHDTGRDAADVAAGDRENAGQYTEDGGGASGHAPAGSGTPRSSGHADRAGPAGSSRRHDPPGVRPQSGSMIPADVLADAVAEALARRPDPHTTVRKPLIHVVVGIDTLQGGDRAAELVGHGPIDAATARALAADAVWRRLLTDPVSGTVLDVGRTSYAPPAALADHVRARDQICRGPQCGRRIRDLDHHQDWNHDGDTAEPNLYGYCVHHHKLKDAPGWQVIAHDDRSLTWISPCGRRHRTEPFDYRPFTDEPREARTAGAAIGDTRVVDAPAPF